MKKINNKKGFTLIELLIVVTILLSLSILGAIKYSDIVEKNNIKLDIVNARTIAEGIKLESLQGTSIDLNSTVSNVEVTEELSKKYFNGDIKPKSKKYSTIATRFNYSINNREVIVKVGSTQVYPEVKENN